MKEIKKDTDKWKDILCLWIRRIRIVEIYATQYDLQIHDSVQFSHSVVSDSLRPHELQHARPPCPSPTPWDEAGQRLIDSW